MAPTYMRCKIWLLGGKICGILITNVYSLRAIWSVLGGMLGSAGLDIAEDRMETIALSLLNRLLRAC